MPMDDFELPELAEAPLDLPTLPGAQPNPQAPQQKMGGLGELAKLLPLIAMAGKQGGRTGIAAFLQGVQRARQAKQQQARLGQQDARQGRIDQGNEDYRQQQLMLQAETKRQADEQRALTHRSQFATALQGVDTPEGVNALLDFYGASGIVPRPELERFAMTSLPPSKLQQRAATARIDKLKNEFGATHWMQEGAKFMHDLPGGERVSFEELLRRGGMTADPNAPAQSTDSFEGDTPEKAHLVAFARGRGKTVNQLTAEELQQATKGFRQADDRPPDPALAEINRQIAQMRLDAMRAAKDTNGLPPAVARRVDARVRGFDSLPIVKTTQKMAEAVTFANKLDPNTKNPADDQALIYAFAKAMDPDSVVREGEYATVQKYAQAWSETFGFNAARIFSNTAFLTPQARANMKRTIQTKYSAGKQQYDNVRRSYATQINRITGQADGEDYLTDYAGGFDEEVPDPNAPRPAVTVTPPARSNDAGPVTAPGANPFRR